MPRSAGRRCWPFALRDLAQGAAGAGNGISFTATILSVASGLSASRVLVARKTARSFFEEGVGGSRLLEASPGPGEFTKAVGGGLPLRLPQLGLSPWAKPSLCCASSLWFNAIGTAVGVGDAESSGQRSPPSTFPCACSWPAALPRWLALPLVGLLWGEGSPVPVDHGPGAPARKAPESCSGCSICGGFPPADGLGGWPWLKVAGQVPWPIGSGIPVGPEGPSDSRSVASLARNRPMPADPRLSTRRVGGGRFGSGAGLRPPFSMPPLGAWPTSSRSCSNAPTSASNRPGHLCPLRHCGLDALLPVPGKRPPSG